MASELIASAIKPRGFLATPSYRRLWFAGGVGNAMPRKRIRPMEHLITEGSPSEFERACYSVRMPARKSSISGFLQPHTTPEYVSDYPVQAMKNHLDTAQLSPVPERRARLQSGLMPGL
jgi:hypothetical protein